MSHPNALIPAILRSRLLRLFSWGLGRERGEELKQTITGREHGGVADAVRLRAVGEGSDVAYDPVLRFMAIAEIHRFSLLRRQVGHSLANALITGLANRLQQSGSVCEIGAIGKTSIEFTFAAPSHAGAEQLLKVLLTELENEIEIDGCGFQLQVVIGATEIAGHPDDDALIDRAAAAVTEAQDMHRKVRVTGTDINSVDTTVSHLTMMRDLRLALEGGGLDLAYQAKLRARTNQIDSAEVLLRWTHSERGPVPTQQFIAAAEASGAIYDLTKWVIDRAIKDQLSLVEQGFDICLYVNLSGKLVTDVEFCRWAVDRLRTAKGRFGFEITETAVIDDPKSGLANLNLFSAAGIRIAIDDYGSGLSSLAYLKQLPANELKIDRMFIDSLTSSHRDPLLVRSSIDLAHALEMDVTAEGVNDLMTLSLLRIMGCDLIQGYLISHPIPLREFEVFLVEHRDAHPDGALPTPALEWNLDVAAATIRP